MLKIAREALRGRATVESMTNVGTSVVTASTALAVAATGISI